MTIRAIPESIVQRLKARVLQDIGEFQVITNGSSMTPLDIQVLVAFTKDKSEYERPSPLKVIVKCTEYSQSDGMQGEQQTKISKNPPMRWVIRTTTHRSVTKWEVFRRP